MRNNSVATEVKPLVFDSDMLYLSLFGMKLIKQAVEKMSCEDISKIEIRKEDLRLKEFSYNWINEIATMVFSWFVVDEEDKHTSYDVKEIKTVIEELGSEDFHEEQCFSYYLDDEDIRNLLECKTCRVCESCMMLYEEYLERFLLGEKRIVLNKAINLEKLSKDELYCIPNLVSNEFTLENVAYSVFVGDKPNEVVIRYINDDSGYFYDREDYIQNNLCTMKVIMSSI